MVFVFHSVCLAFLGLQTHGLQWSSVVLYSHISGVTQWAGAVFVNCHVLTVISIFHTVCSMKHSPFKGH